MTCRWAPAGAVVATLALLALAPSVLRAQFEPVVTTLTDGSGYVWDIDASSGEIRGRDLLDVAFEFWPQLCVTTDLAKAASSPCRFGGEVFSLGFSAMPVVGPLGRGTEVRMGPDILGSPSSLRVGRRVWVPETGVGFARYVEVIENAGVAAITFKVRLGVVGTLGAGFGHGTATRVVTTDRGGAPLAPGLFWMVADDDLPRAGAPAAAVVMDGPGRDGTAAVVRDVDELLFEYEPVTLGPGERAVYVHFLGARLDATDAVALAGSLLAPSDDDFVGLGPFAPDIRNFVVRPPNCGDGVLQAAEGEACDDGNDVDTDACTSFCLEAVCGDGFAWAGTEACDDGNGVDTDECTNACTLAQCGDGILALDEACDDGEGNSDTAADACRTSCEPAGCGDGVVDTDEGCDDGNDVDDDACSNACVLASCGDGVLQADLGEECDDGAMNSDAADACRTSCRLPACGDGIVDGGEGCDDGNLDEADPCNPECAPSTCGDGYVSDTEVCDRGGANIIFGGCNDECSGFVPLPPVDLGAPDLGSDGGAVDPVVQGCDCAAGGDPSSALVVLALLSLRRRRA
ncbi:MAG: DUF4215 domain-containing protein [Myxococcota bacterium]